MAGGYERVNVQDDNEHGSPRSVPNSPPPSFPSRSNSPRRPQRVDDELRDAFGSDDESSDDEADDRQRLVRRTSTFNEPIASSSQPSASESGPPPMRRPPATGRVYGSGNQSDGVFSNLSARPDANGPEKDELPPTYEQAAADQAPPYWETTIMAPGLGGENEVYIEGMPVGNVFSFFWNAIVSYTFQLIGFLLTYLLHSTHAARSGSRAGLGITLIQYGFTLKASSFDEPPPSDGEGFAPPPDPNAHDFNPSDVSEPNGGFASISGTEWLAYILMIAGWFILIRSVSEYLQARRHEQLVLQSPDRGLGIAVIAENEPAERVV